MKTTRKSLLKRYLLIHFFIVTLLPTVFILASFGVSPSVGDSSAVDIGQNYTTLIGLILGSFIVISGIFFYTIRKRLLRLQEAMAKPAENGIPHPIIIEKEDEIGRLENSFNQMIRQLEISRNRELAEESLRRQLIANLSHDLRTPLTTIRGNAYLLNKEPLSENGRESLILIDNKIGHLGQLIENLLSYTLLSSGKYPYRPVITDMVRLVRTSFAAWYPVFEDRGFRIELDLPDPDGDSTFKWEVDPQWMERVLDNFYENISRHAQSGKYIGIKVEPGPERITIEDHGPGLNGESAEKGTGIGLSIAKLMLKEMKLHGDFISNDNGTKIVIHSQ